MTSNDAQEMKYSSSSTIVGRIRLIATRRVNPLADASAPHDAAVGTHEVSVRIDSESGDYALRCASCDWEAERGPDDVHSWNDRSLDLVLLHHVVRADAGVPTPTPPHAGSDSLPRRRLLRPKGWLAEAGGGGEGRNDQQHLS